VAKLEGKPGLSQIRLSRYRCRRGPGPERCYAPEHKKLVMSIGMQDHRKGVDYLIHACARWTPAEPVSIVLAGKLSAQIRQHSYVSILATQSEIKSPKFRYMAHILDEEIVTLSQRLKRINRCLRQNLVNCRRELPCIGAHIEHCLDCVGAQTLPPQALCSPLHHFFVTTP
jgi:hypothetical protein